MDEEKKNLTTVSTEIAVAIVAFIVLVSIFGIYFQSVIDLYTEFLDWWYSGSSSGLFQILEIVFAIFDVVLIGFIAYTFRKFQKLTAHEFIEEVEAHPVTIKDEIRENWGELRKLISSQNLSDWNMAIIRADGLLDEALQRLGYEGDTMADRLKVVDPQKLPSMDRVWSAHRLRNTIVHGPLIEHTHETMQYAFEAYELAFKDLGLIQTTSSGR